MSEQDVPTALYRLFGDEDALLYIGISDEFGRRWHQHAKSQPWWPEVRRQSIDWYPSRPEADAAEKAAIKVERPRYNVTHNKGTAGQGALPFHPRVQALLLGHGAVVRSLRRERKLSQAKLAEQMRARSWAWHQTTVGRVERGEQPIEIGEAVDLAAVYGVPFTEFAEMCDRGVAA